MTTLTMNEPVQVAETTHLRLKALSKVYPGQTVPAVDGVSLSLERGKLLALLGPSGCGKTTTLRMIGGLIDPTSGRVEVNGADITDVDVHKRGIGVVFQSYALFPHLNVARNVAFGLEMRRVSKSNRATRVSEALEMVQLEHLADRKIKELSGGQQQRVALARALVVEPAVLLLDEPLSNLDAKLRDAMRSEIRALVHQLEVTTVFVTHDQDEALSMADQIAVMNDGKVEQTGTPEEVYRRPASRFVADFIGRANLLSGTVTERTPQFSQVDVPTIGVLQASNVGEAPSPGENVTVLVRPHHVHIRPKPDSGSNDCFVGRIVDLTYTGEMLAYSVAIGDLKIVAELLLTERANHELEVGQDVTIQWDTLDALVLSEPSDP